MADCFPPESDDLHRRWLPREIFADIGIVDPEAAAAVVTVAEPTPEAAAAAAVEELAAQLAGILGGGSKVWPLAKPPPQAPPVAASAAPCHGAKVCGLEGSVVVSCGGTNGGGAGGAAVSWPFVPYPQLHWQVGSSLVNHGGVLDYPVLPPALPCHVPPPANLRGGTGVFLPRVEAYRYPPATPAPATATAKGGAWAGAAGTKPWAAGAGSRPAPGKKPQPQLQTEHATPTKQQPQKQPLQQATGAALALPQDWSYR